MRKHYAKGLCVAHYRRPYGRKTYQRLKTDPARYARYLAKCLAAKRKRREEKAVAELAKLAAELEDML